MHSAHKTVGVSAGLTALKAGGLADFGVAGETRRPLRVCLLSACPHYGSDESLAAYEKYLQRYGKMKCSRVFGKEKDDLPGLEVLEQSDCLLLFARRMTIKGEQLERIKRYCRRGGAIVGVRTASHAFENWLEMDKEVLGGDYRGHLGNKLTEVDVVEAAKEHPVLAGVKPFGSRGTLYRNPQIAKDATVLLTGTSPGQTFPVAWVRPHRGGRVFYTSLGHQLDFREPSFLRLLTNAITWTTAKRRE